MTYKIDAVHDRIRRKRLETHADELFEALKFAYEMLEVAVRAGLDGFTEDEEDAIVRDHAALKRIRTVLAKASGEVR